MGTPTTAENPWLMRVPNASFGIVLGLAGTSIVWKTLAATPFSAAHVGRTGDVLSGLFRMLAIVVFAVLSLLFAAKATCWPGLVHLEWRHPVRSHFFNCPHLAILMICLATPKDHEDDNAQHVLWWVCLILQAALTQQIYARWMFGASANIGNARPPFLFSTVGWALLTVLGQQTGLDARSGLNLTEFTFGAGVFFYIVVVSFRRSHSAALLPSALH